MNLYFLIPLAIEVALIIHCIRTGRSMLWLFALMLLPGAGAIAYFLVEILPGLLGSRTTRRAVRSLHKTLDPQQDLRKLEAEVQRGGGVASRQAYAEELTRQGRAADAVGVYRQALTGLYESDPDLMLGLARAQYAQGDYAGCRGTLDTLIARNPDFKSPDGHLLYARALEGEGNRDKALEEYAAVASYYAGAEAPLRYAQSLRASGRIDDARRVLRELLEHARLAPRHYRQMQRQWLALAEHELSSL